MSSPTIQLKRIYDDYSEDDGCRILVDRLWPRGVNKEKARLDEWMKEVAPSTELRKWFHHSTEKWEAFQAKYVDELRDEEHQEAVNKLLEMAESCDQLTLLYAAKDREHNHARVLLDFLMQSD